MDDAFRVRDGQAVGQLTRRSTRPGGSSAAPGAIASRSVDALDQLHRDPRQPVVLANVVDGDDGRVIQRRGGAGFGLEPAPAGLLADQPLGNHLERDGAAETRVDAAVDFAHASRAEEAFDLVGSQSIAWTSAMSAPMMARDTR